MNIHAHAHAHAHAQAHTQVGTPAPHKVGKCWEEFSQKEELTTRIRNILEEYPQGQTILKELLQNADDAGASTFGVCLDLNTYPNDTLLHPGLDEFQGPALLVYNSSVFTEADFQSITSIGQSVKRDDNTKVGKYGLGFNSCYHLSDVVTFCSGESIVCFDPHGKHLPDSLLGLRANVNEGGFADRFHDTLEPFVKGASEAFSSLRRDGGDGIPLYDKEARRFNGTIFRLPLRTESMAKHSLLSKSVHSVEAMCTLMDNFALAASEMVVFLNNIQSINLLVLPAGSSTPKSVHTTNIAKACQLQDESSLDEEERAPRILSRRGVTHYAKSCAVGKDDDMGAEHKDPTSQKPFRSTFELSIESKDFGKASSVSDLSPGHAPVKHTTSHWLVHSGADSSREAIRKSQRANQLPWGGIAVRLSCSSDLPLKGRAYCFLPLPITTGLPVHINGAFAVSSNRRQLWSHDGDDDGDDVGNAAWKAEWNMFLMERLLPKLYAESVALCAGLWKCGKCNQASQTWLFDVTWPQPQAAQSYFKNVANEMIRWVFSEDFQEEVFWSTLPDQEKAQQYAREQIEIQRTKQKKKKKKGKKKRKAPLKLNVLSGPASYSWATPSKSIFIDRQLRRILKFAKDETKDQLLRQVSIGSNNVLVDTPEWVMSTIELAEIAVKRTNGPFVSQQLSGSDLRAPACEILCQYLLASPWEHESRVQEAHDTDEGGMNTMHAGAKETVDHGHDTVVNPESSSIICMKPSMLSGLKIVPLKSGKMGILKSKSAATPPYIMVMEKQFQCLVGNFRLLVDHDSGGVPSLFKLLERHPIIKAYFNIESLSPELLVSVIGLDKIVPKSWKRQQCVRFENPEDEAQIKDNDTCQMASSGMASTKELFQHGNSPEVHVTSIHADPAGKTVKLSKKEKKRLKEQQKAKQREVKQNMLTARQKTISKLERSQTKIILHSLRMLWDFLAKSRENLTCEINSAVGLPKQWEGFGDWPIVPALASSGRSNTGDVLVMSISYAASRGVLYDNTLSLLALEEARPLLMRFGVLSLHLKDSDMTKSSKSENPEHIAHSEDSEYNGHSGANFCQIMTRPVLRPRPVSKTLLSKSKPNDKLVAHVHVVLNSLVGSMPSWFKQPSSQFDGNQIQGVSNDDHIKLRSFVVACVSSIKLPSENLPNEILRLFRMLPVFETRHDFVPLLGTTGLRSSRAFATPGDDYTSVAAKKLSRFQEESLWDRLLGAHADEVNAGFGSEILSYKTVEQVTALKLADWPRPSRVDVFMQRFFTEERLNSRLMSQDAILHVLRETARLRLWSRWSGRDRVLMRAIAEAKIIVLPGKRIQCEFCIDPNDLLFRQIVDQDEENVTKTSHDLITLPPSYADDPLVVETLRKTGMASLATYSCFYRAARIVAEQRDPSKGKLLCEYLVEHHGRLKSWLPNHWQKILAVPFVPVMDMSNLVYPYVASRGVGPPSARQLRALNRGLDTARHTGDGRSKKGLDHRGRENYRNRSSIDALLADETADAMDFHGTSESGSFSLSNALQQSLKWLSSAPNPGSFDKEETPRITMISLLGGNPSFLCLRLDAHLAWTESRLLPSIFDRAPRSLLKKMRVPHPPPPVVVMRHLRSVSRLWSKAFPTGNIFDVSESLVPCLKGVVLGCCAVIGKAMADSKLQLQTVKCMLSTFPWIITDSGSIVRANAVCVDIEAHLGELALAPPSYLPESLHPVLHAAGSSSITGLDLPKCKVQGKHALGDVSKQIKDLYMNPHLSDVTLSISDGDMQNESSFPAHKLVLAMACPAFTKMFSGGFSENMGRGDNNISLPEWSNSEAVKMMLAYIYGKEEDPTKPLKPSNTNIAIMCSLLRLCDFFSLKHLKSLCEVWLADNNIIDVMNVVSLLTHANACKARQLEAHTVACCRQMYAVVSKTEEWMAIDPGLKAKVMKLG